MIDGTKADAAILILNIVDATLGRLRREDPQLFHILTHSVDINDRPKNAKERRGHAISRVIYTWLRREEENPEDVAKDIESLASLGRTERWRNAVKTWAHIARTDPVMFHQYATFANYQAD